MNPAQHPEYELEKKVLRQTALLIEEEIEHHRTGRMESGGNNWTNRNLNLSIREEALKSLEDNQYKPYFARMEFTDSTGKRQNFYFGRAHIRMPHMTVLSWQSPVYSLFIQGNAKQQSYYVPGTKKNHQVNLLLRRRFELNLYQIHYMNDEVDYRQTHTGTTASENSFLIRKLSQRGDPGLQDIVETIQVDQDRIIRADLKLPVILHGVAGSGKTSVAFHRLAYLLFPESGYNLKTSDVLVLAPNRRFLHYVRDLLPALGVKGVQQVTFFDWAFSQIREDRHVLFDAAQTVEDPHFDSFLRVQNSPEQNRAWRSSALKNSLKFRKVLDRYAHHLYTRIQLPDQDVSFEEQLGAQVVQVVFSPHALQEALRTAFETHTGYGERRQQFLQNLQEDFMQKHIQKFGLPRDAEDRAYLQSMTAKINTHFGRLYRRFNLAGFYRELFELETLQQVAAGLLSTDEMACLAAKAPRKSRKPQDEDPDQEVTSTSLEMADVAPLYALFRRLTGAPGPQYRHIIVDEAQDFTPLQFALLREHNVENSYTIVGDTAQNIFAHRGLDSWDTLEEVLGTSAMREKITQNYRSTREIVLLCNAVQQAVRGKQSLSAIPVERSGPKPVFHQSDHEDRLLQVMTEELFQLADRGRKNIAVLTRDQKQAEAISRWLEQHHIPNNLQLENNPRAADQNPDSIVSVLPVAVSKGMEFEAVMVYDVSEANYSSQNPVLGKLLFVAVSRALHELHLYSVGQASEHLKLTRGVRKNHFHDGTSPSKPLSKTPPPPPAKAALKKNPSPQSSVHPTQKQRTSYFIRLKSHARPYQDLREQVHTLTADFNDGELQYYLLHRATFRELLGDDFVVDMDAESRDLSGKVSRELLFLYQLGKRCIESGTVPGLRKPDNVPSDIWQEWLSFPSESLRLLLVHEVIRLKKELYANPVSVSQETLDLLMAFEPRGNPEPQLDPAPATQDIPQVKPFQGALFAVYQLPKFELQLTRQPVLMSSGEMKFWSSNQRFLNHLLGDGLVQTVNQLIQQSPEGSGGRTVDSLVRDLVQLGINSLKHQVKPGHHRPQNIPEAQWDMWMKYRSLILIFETNVNDAQHIMRELYYNRDEVTEKTLKILQRNIQKLIEHPEWPVVVASEEFFTEYLRLNPKARHKKHKPAGKLQEMIDRKYHLVLIKHFLPEILRFKEMGTSSFNSGLMVNKISSIARGLGL
ncbi:HelD family protein [Deinococcus cellulosilyticus]|uniref:DNA 3'-5' helicase n=1 Tax=Deinococcus cellulosilyticus (strain DSM 18568 / NBRC 106333 / KACC 11606 / 5516J-15) TaxID=1223518 RepID=A0A511N8K0_DEIC1|nr:3'-5' exonuclease [Deinococcus cellulosilyticus]GEM49165.1 hypothetical protein DC3_48000 [Deinococcus cellulosilyticus NBRC 106333 = KACC 11606]